VTDQAANAHKIAENATKHAKCTRLWKMSQWLLTGTEKIKLFIDPPWHESEWDDDLSGCVTTAIPIIKGKIIQKELGKEAQK
jgi:hypothetical protein